jgi:hypothetical protein
MKSLIILIQYYILLLFNWNKLRIYFLLIFYNLVVDNLIIIQANILLIFVFLDVLLYSKNSNNNSKHSSK